MKTCTIEPCKKPTRSGVNHYCEMHYYRVRRHGDPNAVDLATGRAMTSNGYSLVHAPNHPQARIQGKLKGWILEHRAVLYDHIGPGVHACHWCSTPVDWSLSYPSDVRALVVDHVDGHKTNNTITNLVPSCNPCNSARDA